MMNRYDLPRGIAVAQAVRCAALNEGAWQGAEHIAKRLYGDQSAPAAIAKAAVNPARTSDAGWAGNLAEAELADFWGIVEQKAIAFRIGARLLPPNVRVGGATVGASAYWVVEGQHVPLSRMTLGNLTSLEPLKVVSAAVFTKETFQFSNLASDEFILRELLRATVAAADSAFIDPANSGVSGSKPASVTNGVTALAASGDTQALVAYDLREWIQDFSGNLDTAVIVCRPELAVAINSFEHPLIGARGGELLQIPVIASRSVPAPAGGHLLILIDGDRIALTTDGAEITTSTEGTVVMADDASGATANHVSLWQSDSIGVKVTRHLNWAALPGAVSVLEDIQLRETSA